MRTDAAVTQILRYEVNVNIFSAVDQLGGFAVLLRAERSLMGAVSVAHGVFEACLWSAAVLDPTLTTDERLQRALTRRLARLSAGIRLGHLLGKSGGIAANEKAHPVPARDKDESDDDTARNRDPAQDVQDITDLSIDWLAENLERRIGLEHYAWEQRILHGLATAWLIRLWSTGDWAGPRLLLATNAEYTGCISLSSEYQRFEKAFWDVGAR